MKLYGLLFTILLCYSSFGSAVDFSRFSPSTLSEIDALRYDFIQLEQELWNTVIDEQVNTISSRSSSDLDLIRSYRKFGDRLEKQFPNDITHGVESLEVLWIWARTYGELRSVYALYETFRRFQKLQTDPSRVPSPKQAWLDIVETILHDGKSSIPDSLKKIDENVKNEKIFQEALKESLFKPCDINQSTNQLLYNLYNAIAVTELKGYMMVQFSWQLYKLFNMPGNFSEEAQLMRNKYYERALTAAEAVKSAMGQTNSEIYKCDPKSHIQGETYTELTKLLQAYIENEIDLSPTASCFKNCAYYDVAKSNGCYKNGYCSKQTKCKGKVLNCQYIDSDMWVCPSDRQSGRRYEYIEYENGRVLGRKMGCNRGTTKVDSWWRYLFWHCSYCICLCDDETNSDRYFNLRQYVTDIKNNRVVTGLRFVKKNKIIHLQIQEGELLPHANINSSTIRWKPVDNYKLTDNNVKQGDDYYAMSFESRDMDLDDLIIPEKYVVTGVKFRTIGTHLNLEIQATPFNFTTGKLMQPEMKSFWHSSDTSPLSRKRLYLQVPDLPTRSFVPSQPDSASGQFVEFKNSDFDRDAGQTTVPFIDIQNVESEIPTPLSGAGIYHKGKPYFGGFVAPKIISYDYGPHIGVVFPPDEAFTSEDNFKAIIN